MSDPITTVVFDIGNVLIEWNPELLYSKLIPDEIERKDFLTHVCSMNWNLQQDLGRSWSEAVETLAQKHPGKASLIEAYSTRWHEMVPGEVPGTLSLLNSVKTSGTPLYAITNFSSEKFAECQDRFPFLKSSFQDIVVSAEERLIKPDPAIYKRLFERNGLNPAACLFIDDSAANITTARQLGMRGHHFQGAESLRQELLDLGLIPA